MSFNYKVLIFLIIAVFPAYSAQQKSNTVVSGNISNPTTNFILIADSTVSLSSSGDFSYVFNISKPTYFDFKFDKIELRLFIIPSQTLEITFDARQFDKSVRFKGTSAAANYILLDQSYTDREVDNYFNYNWSKLFSKGEKDFVSTIDSLKQLYLRTLKAFETRKESLNKDFVFDIKNEVNLGFDRLILLYPQQHLMFTEHEDPFSDTTLKHLNSVDLDNSKLLTVRNYKEFGNEWIDWKVRQSFYKNDSLKKKDNQWLHSAYKVIVETFKDEKVREFWLYYYLLFHIENQGVKNLEEYIKTFNALATNATLKEYINKLYERELENNKGHLIKRYKTVDGFDLDAHIFMPKDLKAGERRPAMVYFHGGSWSEGKPDWHFGQSEYGFINISVEYRTYGRHGVLPFDQVSDAKSFFRWLRTNASELGVDTAKIIASGNSAGGHLILCAAMVDTLEEKGEDLSISSKPNFLILNSAVFDLEGFHWFDHLLEKKSSKNFISPDHNIKGGLPPMLIFHGTDDRAVPIETARSFIEKMRAAGNKVEFHSIEEAPHELWFNQEFLRVAPAARKGFLKRNNLL